MNRRYLAALAAAAVLILAGGLALRGRLLGSAPAASTAAPPSEGTPLRELTQAAQLGRIADYLGDRVTAVAGRVVYVADVGAGGVRWRGDTVLTTAPAVPVAFRRVPAADTTAAPVTADTTDAAPDPAAGRDWLVIVGRTADGRVLSATGIAGGRHPVRCAADAATAAAAAAGPPGDDTIEAYALNVPLADALAGAGVFDLNGRTLGIVARCPGGLAAVPLRDALRLAADGDEPPLGRYGVALAPLDARARAYAGADSGLFVAAVRRGGPADAAGLRVGDVVLAASGAGDGDGLAALLAGLPADSALRVVRQRGPARATVRLAPPAAGADSAAADLTFVADTAPAAGAGVPLAAVRAGSAAAAAGLQPGDRLVRVGNEPVAGRAEAERLLRAAGAQARGALVVVLRAGVERAVWLPGAPR